ncbi:hypothetical protein [Pseudorhodoferax sp.]|uniref:hypothetical protein n=1 Tax=Pseudorhodoferax sp. TaxID=1993553 RepID=UPI0039E66FD9
MGNAACRAGPHRPTAQEDPAGTKPALAGTASAALIGPGGLIGEASLHGIGALEMLLTSASNLNDY